MAARRSGPRESARAWRTVPASRAEVSRSRSRALSVRATCTPRSSPHTDLRLTRPAPEITFAVRGTERLDGDTVGVTGQLTVRGVSRPLSLTARPTGVSTGALTLETEFDVDREQFGMVRNRLGMMRGLTTVTAALRFTRAAA